ncbi:glutathione S-transferase C-terminal domain-containing protein [Bifidobacterium amazonense]|uniref:Glutathione S-transferase C-terminal domain-containing protein n=1 Tax=Bifidobacterium amazonense TaxID=2809027 RepID=A0ABS9VVS7_9BIFI|nr:glutathione S-transferase C-terminal domain-containing protein [Bifidobacterium amazonense]MCH9276167.1 glutathione S-transferase C-terminal domain-containing protein [Bifidobacterium amazonense]
MTNATSTDVSVSFEPASSARKLPPGGIGRLGFFEPAAPALPLNPDDALADIAAESGGGAQPYPLVLSASPLDPRAWPAIIAARVAGGNADANVAAGRSSASSINVETADVNGDELPDVTLYAARADGSTAAVSDDWTRLSRLIERFSPRAGTLYPSALARDIDRLDAIIDQDLIGTLFAVIASSEHPHDERLDRRDFLHGAQRHAVLRRVFYARLGWLDDILSRSPYLLGSQPTDADAHLFGVLFTFDIGYRNAFPVPDAAVVDYPHLWEYARRLYGTPGLVTDDDRRAIGLLPGADGAFAQPWGEPAFTETVDDIRAAWNA